MAELGSLAHSDKAADFYPSFAAAIARFERSGG
jgi:hypothetical protein